VTIRAAPDNGLALIFALKSGTGSRRHGEERDKARQPARFKIIIAAAQVTATSAGRIHGLLGLRYTSPSHGYTP
jgi:hypothetical protein